MWAQSALPKAKKSETKLPRDPHFQTSERCVACHNGMTTSTGEDVSFGFAWRGSMMGNSGRDPYWMAGVRREITEHPTAQKEIEDECTICHMPMMRFEAKQAGGEGSVFAHQPPDLRKRFDQLALDGVSCSLCHQITEEGLGTRQSFVGGFKIDTILKGDARKVFGPYEIDKGRMRVMNSSATYQPTQGKYIQQSELCATCHTLLTQALDKEGKVIGELPEQVPYQEWSFSEFKDTKSCQDCHMPQVNENVPITGVLGKKRENVHRHTFVGGNFFMQRVLNKYRNELYVTALPQELDAAANRTIAHLQNEAAKLSIDKVETAGGRLQAELTVENQGGHKLPTAYPARRVWLHLTIKDRNGAVVFESGALSPDGSIKGNDNDADPLKFEPHYREITSPDQVQIYESVMVDSAGKLTTGLLNGLRYIKDNRLLPRGFNKRTVTKDVAVVGDALEDADFTGGSDRIRYSVGLGNAQGPFQVEAELWYQPIAYRWAHNLEAFNTFESKRFLGYYETMSSGSGVVLAKASAAR
jgi:hypothetical protein